MNTLSEKIRYKRVCKITEVCDTLKGNFLNSHIICRMKINLK